MLEGRFLREMWGLRDGYDGGKAVTGREPFYVSLPGQRPFFMAALWSLPTGMDSQQVDHMDDQASCAILTTEAKDEIRWLHGRMPLILATGQAIAWLDGDNPSLVAGPMMTTQVSKYVNNVAHQGPRCIEKVTGLFD